MDKLDVLFSEKSVENVKNDILNYIIEKTIPKDFEFEFNLKNGSMISKNRNTNLVFNSNVGNSLKEIIKELKDLFLDEKTSEEDSRKAFDEMEKFETSVKNSLNEVLQDGDIADKVREKIRNCVFGKAVNSMEVFPMKTMKIVDFQMNPTFDPDEEGFLIKINKLTPKHVTNFSGKSVSEDLMNLHKITKMSLEDIISMKKLTNDPLYQYVTSAEKKYYDNEIVLSMWIDYNPKKQEETLK